MARREANPFYVEPLGGYDIGAGFRGLAETVQASRAKEEQQQAQAQMQQELSAAYQSGSPDAVAQVMFKYPKMQEQITSAIDFRSKATLNNFKTSSRAILASPDRTEDILNSRIAFTESQGGDATETRGELERYREDPAGHLKDVEMAFAGVAPKEYKAYMATKGPEEGGTANIKDWRHYQKLRRKDPEEAEQFGRQVGIVTDDEPGLKPTTAMQNYGKWEQMPESPERTAFGRMIGIDPRKSPEDARKDAALADSLAGEVENATQTISLIDKMFDTEDYIAAITGIRGATPFAIPGGVGFDATVAFEQLKDSLTLDNLSKMSGLLSDTDIKILSSAGAGLEMGMSEEALRKQLNIIKTTLMKKAERKRGKLEQQGYYKMMQADKPVTEMTDDELMRSAFGGGQ